VSSTKGKRGSVLSVIIGQRLDVNSSTKCPDRLWNPPSLLFKWALSMAIKQHNVRLTIQLHPLPKAILSGVIYPLPSYAITVCRRITLTCTRLFLHTAIPSAACKQGSHMVRFSRDRTEVKEFYPCVPRSLVQDSNPLGFSKLNM